MANAADPLVNGSISVRTAVPGPRSQELAKSAAKSVAAAVLPYGTVFVTRGRGALVEDVDGNVLADFTAGLGCLTVGHSHPHVVAAIKAQAARFLHTDYSVSSYESYADLADRLAWLCGGERKVALFNSGAEAVENSVKIARYVTGKPKMVCFEGAFHGRTHMALSLTAREAPLKTGFGPFSPDIVRLPYPGYNQATMQDFEAAATEAFAADEIAAAIVEPMLGEGGFVVPPRGFLERLKRICRSHNSLLIADEIQTGYGRTGKFLASSHSTAVPDIVLLGKSIAGGLPLSAVIGHADLMDRLPEGSLGGTYIGNPLAIAAALAVLDVIEEERLTRRSADIGHRLKTFWRRQVKAGLVDNVRGMGSMVGAQFHSPEDLKSFRARALEGGVIAVGAGTEGKVLRHLIPAVITDEHLDDCLGVFDSAIRS
ncbi:MAG: aspartate aminotransferase family protein [Actinobacteria bacterium]|nr:aspartate aminotransferase family protein [Actinomycetota bacterium]